MAGWIGVEQAYLRYRRRADEAALFTDLGAALAAAAAGHAGRKRVKRFLQLRADLQSKLIIVVTSSSKNPCTHFLQNFKHAGAIDLQIANQWKFGKRSQDDGS